MTLSKPERDKLRELYEQTPDSLPERVAVSVQIFKAVPKLLDALDEAERRLADLENQILEEQQNPEQLGPWA